MPVLPVKTSGVPDRTWTAAANEINLKLNAVKWDHVKERPLGENEVGVVLGLVCSFGCGARIDA